MVKKAEKKVRFELLASNASKVAMSGDFNAWDKNGIPLKKDRNGIWKTEVSLKPGKYEYKFIVDGQWYRDPTNKSYVRNAFGTENSVKEITA
jgi:1,4-alpha-glucan branching enzyme